MLQYIIILFRKLQFGSYRSCWQISVANNIIISISKKFQEKKTLHSREYCSNKPGIFSSLVSGIIVFYVIKSWEKYFFLQIGIIIMIWLVVWYFHFFNKIFHDSTPIFSLVWFLREYYHITFLISAYSGFETYWNLFKLFVIFCYLYAFTAIHQLLFVIVLRLVFQSGYLDLYSEFVLVIFALLQLHLWDLLHQLLSFMVLFSLVSRSSSIWLGFLLSLSSKSNLLNFLYFRKLFYFYLFYVITTRV